MKIPSLSLRWIDYAGYEMRLPGGKTILLDPCLNLEKEEDADRFYTHGADYIILSHTHYDHTKDIKTLVKKYNPKIIVGAMSAVSLAESFAINLDNLYPVYPSEKYCFDDFDLKVYRGKHKFRKNVQTWNDREYFRKFPEAHIQDNMFGSIEYMDYVITTRENVRMFVSGGGITDDTFHNLSRELEEERPNILFKQTTSKVTPEEYAELIRGYHAQLVFPLHQDGLEKASGMSLDAYFGRVNSALQERNCPARAVNPKQHGWYRISTWLEESEEADG